MIKLDGNSLFFEKHDRYFDFTIYYKPHTTYTHSLDKKQTRSFKSRKDCLKYSLFIIVVESKSNIARGWFTFYDKTR